MKLPPCGEFQSRMNLVIKPISFTQIFHTGNQIHIQPETLTFTDLKPVEQMLKKFRSGLKVLEYGIHYRTT